jgi:hypothetical protein
MSSCDFDYLTLKIIYLFPKIWYKNHHCIFIYSMLYFMTMPVAQTKYVEWLYDYWLIVKDM